MGKWGRKAGGFYSCLLIKKNVIVNIDPNAAFIYKNVGGIDGRLYFVSCIDFGFHRACARTLFCTCMGIVD